jgi:ribosomal protein L27
MTLDNKYQNDDRRRSCRQLDNEKKPTIDPPYKNDNQSKEQGLQLNDGQKTKTINQTCRQRQRGTHDGTDLMTKTKTTLHHTMAMMATKMTNE